MVLKIEDRNPPRDGWNLYDGFVIIGKIQYPFKFFLIQTSNQKKDFDIVWVNEEPKGGFEIAENIFKSIFNTTKTSP